MLFPRRAAHAFILTACLGLPISIFAQTQSITHVLLISIDGMHAVDFMNCAAGLPGVNGGAPYCPALKDLGSHGVNYLNTSTSKPSDSFPGLMALMTGGRRVQSARFTTWPMIDHSLHRRKPPVTVWLLGLALPMALPRGQRPNTTKASTSTRPC